MTQKASSKQELLQVSQQLTMHRSCQQTHTCEHANDDDEAWDKLPKLKDHTFDHGAWGYFFFFICLFVLFYLFIFIP